MHVDHRPTPEIGVILPDTSGRLAPAYAVRAEARGFDRLVVLGGGALDPFAMLGAVAAATTRLRLTAAAIAPRERGAGAVGRAARTLDEVSGGRFALAVTHRGERAHAGTAPAVGVSYDTLLSQLRHGPAAAVSLLVTGADRRTVERVVVHADGLVLPVGATPYDVSTAAVALATRWREHDRGGFPGLMVCTNVPGQVGALVAAGATSVAIVPRTHRLQELDELARALKVQARG
jgi:hypothetical protein